MTILCFGCITGSIKIHESSFKELIRKIGIFPNKGKQYASYSGFILDQLSLKELPIKILIIISHKHFKRTYQVISQRQKFNSVEQSSNDTT